MIAFYKDEEILKTTRRHSLALWIEIICLSIASVAPYVFARLNILFFSSVKTLLTIKMTLVFVGFYCLWLVVVIVFFAIAISGGKSGADLRVDAVGRRSVGHDKARCGDGGENQDTPRLSGHGHDAKRRRG